MLALVRCKDETIHIGEDIRVTILRAGKRVTLGIDAPDNILVLREELFSKLSATERREFLKRRFKEANPLTQEATMKKD